MAKINDDIQQELKSILEIVAQSQNIENYECSPNLDGSKGDGFISEFFSGQVLNKKNGETIEVAIKKAPIGTFFLSCGLEPPYKNEIYFYTKIFPELDRFQREKGVKHPLDQVPKYFAGNIDRNNLFIAMENLKTAGYELFNKKKYLDSEHLNFIFETYGKFHALSFTFKQNNMKEYKNLLRNIINIFDSLLEGDGVMDNMKYAYLSAIDAFDSVTEADVIARLKKFDVKDAFKDVQAYKGNYECLTHGDCWSNNMLFKYKESGELEDIRLIDFQLPRSSTPVHDLSYFFYSGASKEDLNKLDYYLDLYYESFSNFARELGGNPDEILPLDILKKEWKEYALFGLFLGCQVWVIKLMDKDEIEEVLNREGLPSDEYWNIFNEKMSEIRKGALYRERVRNICLHAIEYGVL